MPKKNKKKQIKPINVLKSEREEYYDLIIVSKNGDKFCLHREILKKRCVFFENLDMKYLENLNLCYSTEACATLMNLMYSNSYQDVEIANDCILEVWQLCFQYDIKAYIQYCEAKISLLLTSHTFNWWEIANQAILFKSQILLDQLLTMKLTVTFDITQRLNLDVQKMLLKKWFMIQDKPIKKIKLNEHTQYAKIGTEAKIDTELKMETDMMMNQKEFVFFGEKKNCDLVISNNEDCKFYLHRVVLDMTSTTFLQQYVPESILQYSTETCRIFFALFYGPKNLTTVKQNCFCELFEIITYFKMIHFQESFETEFKRRIENNLITLLEASSILIHFENREQYMKLLRKLSFNILDIDKMEQRTVICFLHHIYKNDGILFDVVDRSGHWYRANLIEKTDDYHIYHFLGWESKFNEKIYKCDLPSRVCAPYTKKLKKKTVSPLGKRYWLEDEFV